MLTDLLNGMNVQQGLHQDHLKRSEQCNLLVKEIYDDICNHPMVGNVSWIEGYGNAFRITPPSDGGWEIEISAEGADILAKVVNWSEEKVGAEWSANPSIPQATTMFLHQVGAAIYNIKNGIPVK